MSNKKTSVIELTSKNDLKVIIQDYFNAICEHVDKKSAFYAALGQTPITGPIFSYLYTVVTADVAKRTNERINHAINLLKESLVDIDLSKIDKNYLKSEEFYDLFHQYLEECSKTRHKEKMELYTKLLKSTIENEHLMQVCDSELYLNILSSLSLEEVNLLKKFYLKEKMLEVSPIACYNMQVGSYQTKENIKIFPDYKEKWEAINQYHKELTLNNTFYLQRLSSNGFLMKVESPNSLAVVYYYFISEISYKLFNTLDIV